MSDETTLRECPFCGGEADEYQQDDGMWRIVCKSCYGEMRGSHRKLNREAWNTRTHGTLTAEQVRDAIERHSTWVIGNNRCFHNGAYEEIADELNATLGSTTYDPKWTLQGETHTQEFWRCECGNCGYEFGTEDRSSFPFKVTIDKVDVPNFCPECGAKQKKAVER